jgi:hypothetical protein
MCLIKHFNFPLKFTNLNFQTFSEKKTAAQSRIHIFRKKIEKIIISRHSFKNFVI